MGIRVKDILDALAGHDPGQTIDVFMAGEAVDISFGAELGGSGVAIQVTAIPPFQLVGAIGQLSHEEMNTILYLLRAHAAENELTPRFEGYVKAPWAAGGVVLGAPTQGTISPPNASPPTYTTGVDV